MSTIASVLAYIPLVGWLIVYLTQKPGSPARFHLRQGVGVVLFLVLVVAGWFVLLFLMSYISMLAALAMALFTSVMAVTAYTILALLMGIINALRGRQALLPLIGKRADQLPL